MHRRCEQIVGKLHAKLAGVDGETLVETLVATLIMALVMLMLCTAIVSAAKINASAKANELSFNQGATEESLAEGEKHKPLTQMSVTVTTTNGGNKTLQLGWDIDAYTQNGYVYYEPHKTSENN